MLVSPRDDRDMARGAASSDPPGGIARCMPLPLW